MGVRDKLKQGAKVVLEVVADRIDPVTAPHRKAQLGLVPKACGNCKHWDQAAFREFVRTNPIWNQLTSHIRPSQMGAAHRAETNTDGVLADTPTPGKPAIGWHDFGACAPTLTHTDKTYVCDKWA